MGGKIIKSDTKISIIRSSSLKVQPKTSSNSIKSSRIYLFINLGNNVTTFKDRNKNKKLKVNHKVEETLETNILTLVTQRNENLDDSDIILEAISKNFFLKNLTQDSRTEIIKKMDLYKVNEDTIILKEGTPGNFFYIIKEGVVEISQNQNIVRTLSRGESFGELALLHNAMRSRTVRSLKKCQFYCIDRGNFKSIMNEMNNQNFEENKSFLDSISSLDSLREEQKSLLTSKLVKENHEENKCIFKEGDSGNCLYLIREGEVNVLNKDNVIIRIMKKGEFFGQLSILLDIPRTMSVITRTKCTFYSISIESVKHIFGEKFRDVLVINSIKQALIKSKYFSKLDIKYIENIFEHFKLTKYEKGCVVLKKGYLCHSKILIVLEGNLINVIYLFI